MAKINPAGRKNVLGYRSIYLKFNLNVDEYKLRGRSQLSTLMKAYIAYARGEGVWDHRTLFSRKSTFLFNH